MYVKKNITTVKTYVFIISDLTDLRLVHFALKKGMAHSFKKKYLDTISSHWAFITNFAGLVH